MTILDTSQKNWDTTPKRVIHTTQHRVRATPKTSVRLDTAQRVQSVVYDAVAEHLRQHPCTPWIARSGTGQGSILKWLTRERQKHPGWQTETVAVLRGAARDAFEATGRWDTHQEELARTVLQEQEAENKIRRGEAPHPNTIEDEGERKEHEPSSRLVRRWTKGPSATGRRGDRTAALRLLQPVKIVDATTVRLPGIGDLPLEDPIPEGADIRSCQVVETTREETPREKKRHRVHLQLGSPVPKTRRRRRMGIDLGVTHAVSTSDGKFFDRPEAKVALEKAKQLVEHARKHCTHGSRGWERHHAQARELRRKVRHIQDNWEHHVAQELAGSAGLLGMESLKLRNMTASGRGTASAPGSNAKHGLNKSLGEARLGTLGAKIERQCLKNGTNLVMVHPGNTSITCNPCKHKDRKSRVEQAIFDCTACAHKANADTNASKNIRDRADNAWTGYRNGLRGQRLKPARAKGKLREQRVMAVASHFMLRQLPMGNRPEGT